MYNDNALTREMKVLLGIARSDLYVHVYVCFYVHACKAPLS
jgi:hypothetical protein